MPILSNKPQTVDGVVYDRLAVNLSISPEWKKSDIGPNVAIRFTPYTKDTDGKILVLENTRDEENNITDYSTSFVYASAVMNDSEVETTVRELMQAVEKLVALKGI